VTDTLIRPEGGVAAAAATPLRLNLGAGATELPGFISVDRKTGGEVYPLDYHDECAEIIRASHVLEHLPRRESLAVLAEWVRVLKPGGWLKVAVPDFDIIVATYLQWRAGELPGDAPPIEGWLMGGQTDANDFHQAVFTRQGLEEAFRELELVEVGPWVSEIPDCAALPISLNVQGRKRWENETTPGAAFTSVEPVRAPSFAHPAPVAEPNLTFGPGTVHAILSAPRLGFTNNFHCAQQVFGPLGIGMSVGFGVFWHAALSRLFEEHLDAELLVVLDYDTTFARADLEALLLLMRRYPEADAICPLQCRREDDTSPLFTVDAGRVDPYGTKPAEIILSAADLAGDLFPIASGHFGLTAIRTSAIRKVPKPWFHAQPGPDGRWDEGRLDADVAWWRDFAAAGCKLFLAPRLVVGHLQLANFWPDRSLKPKPQYVKDWDKSGKPEWTWR
jgi:predicted SAM-dependent methyltransferase